ncbi:mercury transporter [Sporanaerobacter acetigenes]|uniref:Mercury transporter n=2 Tax=Sporanaerobacter acetigenes TaxID=165813 RepID=A0A1M5U848_9FIRM|nr:mercury transporter [Sporanaerobacter acetigenes]SHH59235.1 hypothetical protein SAMN02745180_00558 [Sporanaerobacter acetigenes DSM 13106]
MDTLVELSNVLIWLVRAGVGARIAYCFVKATHNEEIEVYKRRMRNTLIFYILAESVWQLKDIAIYYFG